MHSCSVSDLLDHDLGDKHLHWVTDFSQISTFLRSSRNMFLGNQIIGPLDVIGNFFPSSAECGEALNFAWDEEEERSYCFEII